MYTNQRFSILGDSLSALQGYVPEDYFCVYGWHNPQYGILWPEHIWWGQVLEHFGGTLLVNNSWGGTLVSRGPGCEIESYGCSDSRTSCLGRKPDHILVLMGANDAGSHIPLTGADPMDPGIFSNAYRMLLEKLRNHYPQAVIWCCTLPKLNPAWPTEAYSQVIRQTATALGCHLIDLGTMESYLPTCDGLHPTAEGMQIIAQAVIAAMERWASKAASPGTL